MGGRLPVWFKQKVPDPHTMATMARLMERSHLHTICESALCPNSGECFSRSTATFLILGDVCTRHCTFCSVRKGLPSPPDPEETEHVLEAALALGLHYVVITSVTRDDLLDGGASQFVRVVRLLHRNGLSTEVLVPDFQGTLPALETVVASRPQVINHNVETVPRLYGEVRPGARYDRSLQLLAHVKKLDPSIVTKSGIMVGLGETSDEIIATLKDLRSCGCDLVTIGQYLQPSPHHHPIARFVAPQEFTEYEKAANDLGFGGVASAPLVRSSFRAAWLYANVTQHHSPTPDESKTWPLHESTHNQPGHGG